jgi:hypothetical protein
MKRLPRLIVLCLLSTKFSRIGLGIALIILFSGNLAHAQEGLDPRCGDRAAKGKIICTINKPNVTRRETVHSNVVFAPGDTVVIGADGCVQTGGFGDTWKLYVNPIGEDSDRLYHGLIRIPTATRGSSLVRIKDVKGTNLKVAGSGVALSQLVLHLGYEDDDYSDNGYDNHDDGIRDQCKGIGPAVVRIVIFRGAPPPPTPSKFDFNLEWDKAS